MRGVQPTVVIALLTVGALAGCIGGDEVKAAKEEAPPVAEEAVVTDNTGSVKGQIITVDLIPVVGETVGLLAAGNATPAALTTTDTQGRFTFNGVEPGRYRVHVTALCCVSATKDLDVVAGTVSEAYFQLELLVNVVPYVESNEWKGFISCSLATPVILVALCFVDPNDTFSSSFEVAEGLQSYVVGMTWQGQSLTGKQLALLVEGQGYTYARMCGEPPIFANVNDDTIENKDAKFAAITEEGRTIGYRVFACDTAGLIYQQPFAVYWDEYYNQRAPEGANPIPDG